MEQRTDRSRKRGCVYRLTPSCPIRCSRTLRPFMLPRGAPPRPLHLSRRIQQPWRRDSWSTYAKRPPQMSSTVPVWPAHHSRDPSPIIVILLFVIALGRTWEPRAVGAPRRGFPLQSRRQSPRWAPGEGSSRDRKERVATATDSDVRLLRI